MLQRYSSVQSGVGGGGHASAPTGGGQRAPVRMLGCHRPTLIGPINFTREISNCSEQAPDDAAGERAILARAILSTLYWQLVQGHMPRRRTAVPPRSRQRAVLATWGICFYFNRDSKASKMLSA